MKLDERLLRRARGVRVELAVTIALGLLAGVLLVWQARYLAQIVNRVFLEQGTLGDVRSPLTAFLMLALLRAGASWGSEVSANRAASRVKIDLRERLSTHVLTLGPAYARGERSGELTNTMVEGVEGLDAYFSQYLPQLALAALVPLTILVFIFALDWLSALVLFLTAPLMPLFMVLIGSRADVMTKRQWVSLSRMSAHFLDVLQGLSTLRLLGRSREQVSTIASVSDRYRKTTLGVLRVAFLSAMVLELVATLSTAIVAVEIGLRLLDGRLAFEQAFLILLLTPEFYLPLRLLGVRFHAGVAGVTAAGRIFEVLDECKAKAETKVEVETQPEADAERSLNPDLNLVFSDVYYAYDGGKRPALNGVSFQIKPGQRNALIGSSGAGKSTVAYLLLRFIEPNRGTVLVNGQNLQALPAPVWRAQLAWVPQNPYLFHATVADNIRLARPQAGLEDVVRAAGQAYAHEFIQSLPQGYGTLIGERGARLSAGQAQRVALARAFLKDAPLLILDEATSNLDPVHETLVQEAIGRLMQGRTVLVIAHRLNTVFRADQILVLAGGRVVENGTHRTLLESDGPYRRMVNASYSMAEQRQGNGHKLTLSYGEAT